jgi:hypothetical protein
MDRAGCRKHNAKTSIDLTMDLVIQTMSIDGSYTEAAGEAEPRLYTIAKHAPICY